MSTQSPRPTVIPITPVAGAEGEEEGISLFAAHEKIYPRSVKGWFASWRWLMVWLTQLVFYGLPWLEWGQRQAVLFDLQARRFYIFSWVLYPQDFIYLTGLLVICALSLFLFTAVAGRLWCGYACPQTVYSEIFMWVERWVEGRRTQRMKLDGAGLSLKKVGKKTLKHAIWLSIAAWTGFTFVGYFTPMRQLGAELALGALGSWEIFWIVFYGFATYGNAGFMREQVCKYMCPYARFQSAMFDKDTLMVTYDAQRGEPRGNRGRQVDAAAQGMGDCIDCGLCVQVCPTGIDIRQGLQYECIGCAACIDVCNTVMKKMNYPLGLVRYSTQNALTQGWKNSQMWRQFRPRIVIYALLLASLSALLLSSLLLRVPLKVDVVRDRGTLARIVAGGQIENVYRLQLMNATEVRQQYRLSARGLPGLKVASDADVQVDPAQSRWVAVRLNLPYGASMPGSHPIYFDVVGNDEQLHVSEKSVFLVPR